MNTRKSASSTIGALDLFRRRKDLALCESVRAAGLKLPTYKLSPTWRSFLYRERESESDSARAGRENFCLYARRRGEAADELLLLYTSGLSITVSCLFYEVERGYRRNRRIFDYL